MSGPNQHRLWFFASLAIVWVLALVRLFYWQGSGEHDTFMMAAGVVQGAATGLVINSFCYGEQLQFLFYYLARLFTSFWTPTSQGVFLSMNMLGAALSLVNAYLLLLVFERLFESRGRALAAAALLVSSPVFWFLVPYGHPFHLALAASLLAWVLALDGVRAAHRRVDVGRLALAGVLQGLAFSVRFEQVLFMSFLVIGYAVVRFGWRPLPALIGVNAIAGTIFVVARSALASPMTASVATPSRTLADYLVILRQTVDPSALSWGMSHMVSEVGLPLILLSAAAAAITIVGRHGVAAAAMVLAVGPSLAVYAGNPSPPRHFFVVAAGLACAVAMVANDKWVRWLSLVCWPILVLNLVLPWSLRLVRPGSPPPVVGYNVIERTDRNRAQISQSRPVYEQVIARSAAGPIVVFGNWVHVAQLAALLADEGAIGHRSIQLTPGVKGLEIAHAGHRVVLVEMYDGAQIRRVADAVKREQPAVRCIALVPAAAVNDLGIPVPPEVDWWTS